MGTNDYLHMFDERQTHFKCEEGGIANCSRDCNKRNEVQLGTTCHRPTTGELINCQDNGTSIRFPSLLIWLAITDITPVREAEFMAIGQSFMFNFRSFLVNNPKKHMDKAKMLFEQWFQNLKVKCGRWRVAQNVQRSLPSGAYIDLQLDYTRVWSGVDEVGTASDLDYIPLVAEIYAELSSQTGCQIQPPSVALATCEQLSIPLTEEKK